MTKETTIELPQHLIGARLLSSDEVCQILKIGKSTLYRYMKSKKDPLPSFVIGGTRRFRADQITWWVDKHAVC